MLVLSRKIGEKLVIDDNIVITVLSTEGNKLRLGIQAPLSVRVDRDEVYQRRMDECTSSYELVGG